MRLAIIPARGGSKRIPRKNIKLFCGKPMIAWSIEAAQQSGCFDRIVVSTDDEEIAKLALLYGATVPFMRPAELSDDHTGTIPVIRHAIEWFNAQGHSVEYACCLYATAPFIAPEDVRRGFRDLTDADCDYAFAVTTYAFPIQRAIGLNAEGRVEMFNPEHFNTRSQDLDEAYHDAGQFYWGTADAWLQGRKIFSSGSVPVALPRHRVQDIDTSEDWLRAEWLFKSMRAEALKPKRVAFRVDASIDIGTGHAMRCLTLADAIKVQGGECQFFCRDHPGNLIEHIRRKGFQVHVLPHSESTSDVSGDVNLPAARPLLAHAAWLGSTQAEDANQCAALFGGHTFDWLIVDHYALDARWETALKAHYRKLMVIDDLADRSHQCDLLLDQTFGCNANDYAPLVPRSCTLLCGSQYSLLRPEFAALRVYSLERRKNLQFEHLLVTMGGVDKDNATGQVLQALKSSELPANCRITVVMGTKAPWLTEVRQLATHMPWPTTVEVGISDMAQLMADSDLAIGASGATSWERCCLGLPTVMAVLAENQRKIAHNLELAGAVFTLQKPQEILNCLPRLLNRLISSASQRAEMTKAASALADGQGVPIIVHHLEL